MLKSDKDNTSYFNLEECLAIMYNALVILLHMYNTWHYYLRIILYLYIYIIFYYI